MLTLPVFCSTVSVCQAALSNQFQKFSSSASSVQSRKRKQESEQENGLQQKDKRVCCRETNVLSRYCPTLPLFTDCVTNQCLLFFIHLIVCLPHCVHWRGHHCLLLWKRENKVYLQLYHQVPICECVCDSVWVWVWVDVMWCDVIWCVCVCIYIYIIYMWS